MPSCIDCYGDDTLLPVIPYSSDDIRSEEGQLMANRLAEEIRANIRHLSSSSMRSESSYTENSNQATTQQDDSFSERCTGKLQKLARKIQIFAKRSFSYR